MKISKSEFEKTKFVFQYYLDRTFGEHIVTKDGYTTSEYRCPQIGLSLIYDEGIDFVSDWMEAFPGRKPDNEEKAKVRLTNFLKQLVSDGWMERFIAPNYIEYLGEAGTWQYVYALKPWLINDLKRGKTTVSEQASKYTGWVE